MEPLCVTMRSVFDDEPMAKAGPLMPLGFTERSAHGVDEAMPRAPAEVKVEVAVAPKAAVFERWFVEKSAVVEAAFVERFPLAVSVVELVPPIARERPERTLPKSVVPVALVKKRLVAVKAVDDAYGNCEAATVEEEKKTP